MEQSARVLPAGVLPRLRVPSRSFFVTVYGQIAARAQSAPGGSRPVAHTSRNTARASCFFKRSRGPSVAGLPGFHGSWATRSEPAAPAASSRAVDAPAAIVICILIPCRGVIRPKLDNLWPKFALGRVQSISAHTGSRRKLLPFFRAQSSHGFSDYFRVLPAESRTVSCLTTHRIPATHPSSSFAILSWAARDARILQTQVRRAVAMFLSPRPFAQRCI
jgi:hypothetical protein